MKKIEKPTFEIVEFKCKDVITSSNEHDNGYVGGDILKIVNSQEFSEFE